MGERLRHPCQLDSLADPLPNLKSPPSPCDFDFDEFALATTERVRQLWATTADAQLDSAAVPSEEARQPAGQAEAAHRDPYRLCTGSQFSFTVPPATPPFHVRFRTDVGGKKEPWENPLAWKGGHFFSPRLRAGAGGVAVPPPVVLSAEWEKANIEGGLGRQQGQEGDLRMFTLAGLTPSVETSGWSGWLMGKAGQGVYGVRTLEVEFAEAAGQSWEATSTWALLEPLRYRIPVVDAVTALLTLLLNWGRSEGVQKMQEALTSELGRKNRKANLRMIHDFVVDMHTKLTPVWYNSIEPWMAQNPTLAILVAERRWEIMRGFVINFLKQLRNYGMIHDIPKALIPIRPRLVSLQCLVRGAAADTRGWVDVAECEEFSLAAEAVPAATGADALKLWWVVLSTNEPGLDMMALTGQPDGVQLGPGGRLHLQSPVPGANPAVASGELHVPGRNKWGNPLLEAGTELVIRVVVEEAGAHEDDCKDVRIRVQGKNTEERERSDSFVPEASSRPTAPRVWGTAKTEAEATELFETIAQHCESAHDAVRSALESAGHFPSHADIASAVAAIEGGDAAGQAAAFAAWYKHSVFGSSLLGEGWQQAQDTLRRRRNRFLAETLEIPQERWGFSEDEWGGMIPEAGLVRQHAVCVAKQHLASVWESRNAAPLPRRAAADAGEESRASSPPQPPPPAPPLRLEDPESVDQAALLAVVETFAAGMMKHYMSRLLPLGPFGDEQRRKWVETVAYDQSLLQSAEQILTFKLAEYYRITRSEETAEARRAAAAARAAREAKATDWLEGWRQHGEPAGPPPTGAELVEVAKVVAKTAVRQEVEDFLKTELLPTMRSIIRERVMPQLMIEARAGIVQFCRERWLGLGLVAMVGAAVGTVVVVGPWAALYALYRRELMMHRNLQ